jgi:hypothetical protein
MWNSSYNLNFIINIFDQNIQKMIIIILSIKSAKVQDTTL